jgi:hypothetical protein
MVAGRTHFHCRSYTGRGTIVVDDSGALRAWKCVWMKLTNFFYISGMKVLDYLIKWDYIGTWVAWSPEVYHESSQELRRWE